MIKLLHNLSLSHGISDLVVANELLLGHGLHGVDDTTVTLLDTEDFTERSFAQDFDDLKVTELKISLYLC